MNCGGSSASPRTEAPASHTVNLAWVASESADVAGYNVYRAVREGSCGAFSKINSDLITATTYSDSAVANGVSYCYAATSVSVNNQESDYSNVVMDVQIPVF